MNQLCGVGHITAQAFVLTLRSKRRFPTFQVSKQKAVSSVRASSSIGGEIVADFEGPVSFGISRCLRQSWQGVVVS